jgi:hypothetical protein
MTKNTPIGPEDWIGPNAFPQDRLQVPSEVKLDLERGLLVWGGKDKEKDPGPTVLREFIRVIDAPEQALRFSRKWGPLGVCHEHGRIWWKEWQTEGKCSLLGKDRSDPKTGRPTRFWEPLSAWYRYAAHARALLVVAGKLEMGELPGADDWKAMCQSSPWGDESSGWLRARRRRDFWGRTLFSHARSWIDNAGVQPIPRYDGVAAKIVFGGYGVLGVVAARLLWAVVGMTDGAFCSGCGGYYDPTAAGRRPRAGLRNYCRACRRDRRQADASRDYRARKRRAIALRREGRSIRDIAAELERPERSVGAWVRSA